MLSDEPSLPVGPIKFKIKSKTLTIQWKTPKDNGGDAEIKYILKIRGKISEPWQNVGENIETLKYDVKGVEFGKEFQYCVQAQNKHGVSDELTSEVTKIGMQT